MWIFRAGALSPSGQQRPLAQYADAPRIGGHRDRRGLHIVPLLLALLSVVVFAPLLAGLCLAVPAQAQPGLPAPDPRPVLRIETGMHTAPIWRLGADRSCRLLVSGSLDKTVRLWSMPEGRLLRTQRLPIGDGDGGKVFSVAVSPDGAWVAAGGWDATWDTGRNMSVSLFDSATGLSIRRLGSFGSVITHLAFSADGRRLAVALGGGQGVRVVEVASGRELTADRDYGGKASYGVAFSPDGSLHAVGDDGFLRRYGPDGRLAAKVVTEGGKEPFSVAVDPTGRRLAVGYADTASVDLYEAASLRRIGAVDTRGINKGNLGRVAWSADGRRLAAGGRYSDRNGRRRLLSFTPEGRRLGPEAPAADDTIMSLAPCGDGVGFGAADPSFGLLRPDGQAVTLARGRSPDMRDKLGEAFTVSSDGRQIRFGLGRAANQPVLFDLGRSMLTQAAAAVPGLIPPRTGGIAVTEWMDTMHPRLGGKPIALREYEVTRSLAVRPDRSGFVLGTEWSLRAYDASGRERWPDRAGPGVVWGVNLARDGELIVAAYGDGTVRWHLWRDGAELLALFVDRQTKAWVAWTPRGYYAASPGGEELIGWHVNRGWEQPADFFPASKFRDTYARPDIVERVLATLDEDEAVRQANAALPGRVAPAKPIADLLPPVVSILSPGEGTTVAGASVRIDYLVRSPAGLPVDRIEALVDGRPAGAGRGLGRIEDRFEPVSRCLAETQGRGRLEGGLQGCRGSLTVSLPPGTHQVGLFARTGERAGEVVQVRLTRAGVAAGAELLKPKLYALVIGISAYANPDYALAYAAKDARDFAATLAHQKGGLYGDVTVRMLVDGQASAAGIREGLDWLTQQVTSADIGVVYLAGHGLLDERGRFYFLAADSDTARLRATAVPREDLQDALSALAGKALLFLDACHSGAIAGAGGRRGGLDINSVVNGFAQAERGVVMFTASTGKQVSQENPAWGNGAFTKAVVEGLGLPGQPAKADLLGTGAITTSALDAYVRERVKSLTGGTQSPVMIRPATVPDFDFAIARQ